MHFIQHYRKVFTSFMITALIVSTGTVYAQNNKGKTETVTFNGNILEVKNFADTVTMLDPVTAEVYSVINNPSPIPVKINGVSIYGKDETDQQPGVTENTLKVYLLHKLKDKLSYLADGEYRLILNSVVISANGKVVYYDYIGIDRKLKQKIDQGGQAHYKTSWKEVKGMQTNAVRTTVKKVLSNTPKYKPAIVSGAAVPCRMSDEAFQQPFYMKGGTVYHH